MLYASVTFNICFCKEKCSVKRNVLNSNSVQNGTLSHNSLNINVLQICTFANTLICIFIRNYI